MKISYKPLWKLLIDRDMKKKDLCDVAGISPASVTKMGKCGSVTTETLEKICTALNCQVQDIMEVIKEKPVKVSEEERRCFCYMRVATKEQIDIDSDEGQHAGSMAMRVR